MESSIINEENLYNDTRTSSSELFSWNVIVSMIFGVIFVTGTLGNITTCIVIRRNRAMHTATNFYLFNLAISDFLLLIVLPFELYRLWNPFSYALPEKVFIILEYMLETSATITSLTITAFTVERYIVLCRPFMSHRMSQLSGAVRYIFNIWAFSQFSAILQVRQFEVVPYKEKGLIFSAGRFGNGVQQGFVLSSFIFFVVMMSLTIILFVLIFLKLDNSHVLHPAKKFSFEIVDRSGVTPRHRSGSSHRRVIRMLVAVALSCFLCWAPFHVQKLIAIYGNNLEHPTDTFYKIYTVLTTLSGVLLYLSTSIKPFLYSIMSNKFRDAFKVTLSSWCTRKDRSQLKRANALLAERSERAAARSRQRRRNPRMLRRLATGSSQRCVAPPQAQSFKRRNLTIVIEESDSLLERHRLQEGSDSMMSPQIISNSNLRDVDQEISGQDLATYSYQMILGETTF